MVLKVIAFCGAAALAGLPAFADPAATIIKPLPGVMIFRDSDGVVISVIHTVDYGFPGTFGGVDGIYYTLDGHVLEFSGLPVAMSDGMTNSAAPNSAAPTVVVGGTRYTVEADGADIWLIDPSTGKRLATERRMSAAAPDALGHKVNPVAFSLE